MPPDTDNQSAPGVSARAVPFHLIIGPLDDDGHCLARAVAEGREAVAELYLPDEILLLGERLMQPGMHQAGDLAEIGRTLGRALFAPQIRHLLLETARAAAAAGARVQLRLQINSPELAALPWEWLALGTTNAWMPALRDDYALFRLGRRYPPPAPPPIHGALRILAIAAPGAGHHLDALDDALASYVRAERIDLRLLPDATPATLRAALADEPSHVLHIAARVTLTPHDTLELGIGAGIEALELADLLAESPQLRLVTFTGGDGDGRSFTAATTLLGATLVHEQLPAAIAFSTPLSASATARFAAMCYGRLAAGAAIDQAVTAGRAALAHTGEVVWGAPLLRLATEPGALCEPPPRRAARPLRAGRFLPYIAAVAVCLALILGGVVVQQLPMSSGVVMPERPTARVQAAPTDDRPAFALPRLLFGEPTATPTPSATPTPTPLPEPAGYTAHTVAEGETLAGIAALLGSDAAAIAALNGLDAAATPRPARALIVPRYRAAEAGSGLGEPVRRGNPASGKVALTFDIEIDDATLYAILDALRQREVKGTFFVTGGWVQRFPDAARAIVADGHEMANHSLTHPYFSQIGLDGVANELRETERIVREVTGVSTRPYFRFPYGDSTPGAIAAVMAEGYIPYHWSADDPAIPYWLDAAAINPTEAAGGILLLHGRAATAGMLPEIIDRLRALGLEPASLGETLR